MTKAPKNMGASVRARLLKLATERREDFQLLLSRYANERLLHRLSVSPHASQFILKGATLFTLWTGRPHRATRDLDLLGFGDPGEVRLRAIFEDVLRVDVGDDGVVFDVASLEIGPIREGQEYSGVRLLLRAKIVSSVVRLQVDVGFGDAVTPGPETIEFPGLLDFPRPVLRSYPRATVVAEKVEAMVQLGLANSRMKDFFDVVLLARLFAFDGVELARAIRSTFERRATALPTGQPVALTAEFANDPAKRAQWGAFLRKSGSSIEMGHLGAVIAEAERFVSAPLAAAAAAGGWVASWAPGGPWR